jgi:hypothetical protein
MTSSKTLNKKNLEHNISNLTGTSLSLFDVRSKISPDKTSALLIFMIDEPIYNKCAEKVDNCIHAFINDFKEYFKKSLTPKKDPIKLCSLLYSSKHVSEIIRRACHEENMLMNDLLIKTPREDNSKFDKGEIKAFNKLCELNTDYEEDRESFLFHFCGPEEDIDCDIYEYEFKDDLRKLDLKYEIIYFGKKNEKYESKLSGFINFEAVEVSI